MHYFPLSTEHFRELDPDALSFERSGMLLCGSGEAARPRRRKIWGERASGTNYASFLLAKNLPALAGEGARLQWKHGLARLRFPDRNCLNLFVVRDPFTWAQSFFRNPWHLPRRLRDRNFAAFIREEWVGVFHDRGIWPGERPADRHPLESRRYRDIWEMRSVKLRHAIYAAATLPNGVIVRYEDISADPEGYVAGIAARFELEPGGPFQSIDDYKGYARKPYVRSRYESIGEEDRVHIVSRLDPVLERFFGYVD